MKRGNSFLNERYAFYKAGKTDKEIAELQYVVVGAVTSWRHRYNLPPNQSAEKQWGTLNKRRRQMCEKGYSDTYVAAAEGITLHSLKNWKRRNKIELKSTARHTGESDKRERRCCSEQSPTSAAPGHT